MNPLSEAAREASRRNGRLSKGPQTVLGRQISARNSFKHGLRGRLSTEPEFLPVWLRSFGERVSFLFGYITQRRREHLDRLLESMLLTAGGGRSLDGVTVRTDMHAPHDGEQGSARCSHHPEPGARRVRGHGQAHGISVGASPTHGDWLALVQRNERLTRFYAIDFEHSALGNRIAAKPFR